jgi:uncharacterized membrane protein YhaH (DUF805 family)
MDGRVNRMTWWRFAVSVIGIFVLAFVGLVIIAVPIRRSWTNTILALNPIVAIILAAMGIVVNGKRVHDRDTSAWWVLVGFVPYPGWIRVLVDLGFLRGAPSGNRFGHDSTGRTVARFAKAP